MTDSTTRLFAGRRSDPVHRILAVLTAAPLAFSVLVGCGGGGGGSTGPDDGPDDTSGAVASVAVSPDTAAAATIGGTVQFRATAKDRQGNTVSGVSFSWSSSATEVATVSGQGLATARENGAAVVRASTSGVTGSSYLTVRAGELAWKRISSGNIFGCGITSHGTAYCWGDNVHGELGDGNTTQLQLTPVRVRARLYFEKLTLGGAHICALTYDGTAHCWGNSSFGEGGYGQETGTQTDPVEVSGGHTFRQIAGSGNHTCGVTTEGIAYCWGRNANGQLGDGTTRNHSRPVQVAGGLSFQQIGVGSASVDNHTCGVTTDGPAYCWGVNSSGELGDGTTEERVEPVPVEGGHSFAQISGGGTHTCGVTTDGTAYCWGGNSAGQLGDGTTEDRMTPVEVSGGHEFQLIAASNIHTCGLATDGTVYCWGGNVDGRLGDGTTVSRPTPVEVVGDLTFRHISPGADHTCGVTVSDTGYCWGNNDNAQLGTGDRMARDRPTPLLHPGEL